MRQVKRYTTNVGYGHEEHDGEFVMWSDYAALAAENERLKNEVKSSTKQKEVNSFFISEKSADVMLKHLLSNQITRLTAENERLRKDIMEISNAAKMVSEIGIKAADELTMLKDQNERLMKAGDEMRSWIICEGYDLHCVDDWNAAKEGGAK